MKRGLLVTVRRFWHRREERILQAVVIICLAGMALLALTGCASFAADLAQHEERHCEGWTHTGEAPFYAWERTRPASLKPWLYVYALDVDLACRTLGMQSQAGHRINACAQWREANCLIILPEGFK